MSVGNFNPSMNVSSEPMLQISGSVSKNSQAALSAPPLPPGLTPQARYERLAERGLGESWQSANAPLRGDPPPIANRSELSILDRQAKMREIMGKIAREETSPDEAYSHPELGESLGKYDFEEEGEGALRKSEFSPVSNREGNSKLGSTEDVVTGNAPKIDTLRRPDDERRAMLKERLGKDAQPQPFEESRDANIKEGLNGLKNMAEGFSHVNDKLSYVGKHAQYLKLNWKQNFGKLAFGLLCVAAFVTASVLSMGTLPAALVASAVVLKIGTAVIGSLAAGILAFGKTFSVEKPSAKAVSQHQSEESVAGHFHKTFESIDRVKDGPELYKVKMQFTKALRNEAQQTSMHLAKLRVIRDQTSNPSDKIQIQNEIDYHKGRLERIKEIFFYTDAIINRRNDLVAPDLGILDSAEPSGAIRYREIEVRDRKVMLKGAVVALAKIYEKDLERANQAPVASLSGEKDRNTLDLHGGITPEDMILLNKDRQEALAKMTGPI